MRDRRALIHLEEYEDDADGHEFDPAFVFEPEFLDDQLSQLYRSESNLMKLTSVFAGICIFISVIGLFGLTAFTTELRTKEIGIRKVLGASNLQIVTLLSRRVFFLVLVATIPASAVSYYAIDKWLQRFAYHIEIGWGPFATATLIVAVVTLVTAATQSLKAASANTIDSLRYE